MKTFKISALLATIGSFIASVAFGATETVSTIPTIFGDILSGIVQAIIATIVSFLTSTLGLIVVTGVSISAVFWLIYKMRGASRGK